MGGEKCRVKKNSSFDSPLPAVWLHEMKPTPCWKECIKICVCIYFDEIPRALFKSILLFDLTIGVENIIFYKEDFLFN